MRRRSPRTQLRIRRQRREERIHRRNRDAAHLRELAARLATRPRRSLRLQWLRDNGEELESGFEPSYYLILFGEVGYTDPFFPDEYPADGYDRYFPEAFDWMHDDDDD